MASKMSDPNSTMMQMIMAMVQNQQPSGNIIKSSPSNRPINMDIAMAMGLAPQMQGMQGQYQNQYAQYSKPYALQAQEIRPKAEEPKPQFVAKNIIKEALTPISPEEQAAAQKAPAKAPKAPAPTPTEEQKLKAKILALQFAAKKSQSFSDEEISEIEGKILERMMQ